MHVPGQGCAGALPDACQDRMSRMDGWVDPTRKRYRLDALRSEVSITLTAAVGGVVLFTLDWASDHCAVVAVLHAVAEVASITEIADMMISPGLTALIISLFSDRSSAPPTSIGFHLTPRCRSWADEEDRASPIDDRIGKSMMPLTITTH